MRLIRTDVAVSRCIIDDDMYAMDRPGLTNVRNIAPSTGHQDSISKAMRNPEDLLNYP